MDTGFVLRSEGNQQFAALTHSIKQDEAAAAACSRPLSTQEMQDILQVDALELDLFVSLEILKPSLFLEYVEGQYLGFFNFWDCLDAKISLEFSKATCDPVISDKLAATIVVLALGASESYSITDLLSPLGLRTMLEELFDDLGLGQVLDEASLDRLSASLIQIIKAMHVNLERTVFDEDPVHFSPFSVVQCS